jgi:hypothetical protein
MAGARSPMTLAEQVQRSARDAARRYAGRLTAEQKPPQPPLDIQVISDNAGAKTNNQRDRAMVEGMEKAFRHAELFSPKGPDSGYLVTGLNTVPPRDNRPANTDAVMSRSTPNEMMEGFWGDAWPEVRAAVESGRTPPVIRYPAASTTSEHLRNPFYIFDVKGSYPSHVAGNGRSVVINPDQAAKYGADPSVVRGHEAGHWIAQMGGQYRDGNDPVSDFRLGEVLMRDHGGWVDSKPGVMQALMQRLRHISKPSEMAAYFNHLRRQHYAVTGNPTTTRESRIKLLSDILNSDPRTTGKPVKKFYEMFPGAPEMQHGPMKGQPAEGYDFNWEMIRMLYPELKAGQKMDVKDAIHKGASATDPNENVYV